MFVTNIMKYRKWASNFISNRSTESYNLYLNKSIFVLSMAHKYVQLKVGSPYNSSKIGC